MANVKLLGEEAEGSEAEGTHNPEIPKAFQFVTGSGGYADTLHIKFSASGTGTSGKLGIFTEGATKPVQLLVEGNLASVAVGEQKVEIPATYLGPATQYWLALLPLGGTVKLKLGKTTKKGVGKEKRLTLAAVLEADWEAAALTGPMAIWATGERYCAFYPQYPPNFYSPSGLYKPFPTQAAEVVTVEIVSGKATGTLLLTGISTGIAVQKVSGVATGALLLTGTSKGTAIQQVLGKTTGALLLTGTSKGVAVQKVTAQAAGTMLLTGTSVAMLKSVVIGQATGTLFLLGSGKVLEPKAAAGNKIAIFIFDE